MKNVQKTKKCLWKHKYLLTKKRIESKDRYPKIKIRKGMSSAKETLSS